MDSMGGDLDAAVAPQPYVHLTERAYRYVSERGGSVAEDALIAFVFGSAGPPSLWQPLLRQILSSEHRLVLRPDERWSLAVMNPSSSGGALLDFVALDVETTGLQAQRQRVIDIALIRYTGGQVSERFSSLVNPERRIPAFISKLTGISNEDVASAPRFAEIAQQVEEFLDGALLVGHNVGFDIGFVSAELARTGRAHLINERLDTMGLATRLLPGVRRPSLDKVALALGLTPRKIHRAEVDAELTANVALHLAARASDLGIDTVDRLRSLGRPTDHRIAEPISRGSSVMDRSILATIPKRPGVYLMHDANERIIYIGKAKSLRDRVSTYFSQPLGYTRKMDGLLESIARIETIETGSELGALLLESQLIRRYTPRYNVVMRSAEEYPFIRVDLANAWPKISLAKARKDDGARYFGPFKSRKAVRTAIELVNDSFPLRTCTRSFKDARSYGSPCIQLDLGKCLGPCAGRADRDAYMEHVRGAVAFLEGDDETLLLRMWEQLETAAVELNYERARKLRNNVQLLQNLVGAHRRLKAAEEENTLAIAQPGVDPDTIEVMIVVRGQLWSSHVLALHDDATHVAQRLATSWARRARAPHRPLDHLTLDDVSILNRWIAKMDGSPCLIRFEIDAPYWDSVAACVLSLRPEDMLAREADELLDDSDTTETEAFEDGTQHAIPSHGEDSLLAETPA